MFTYGYCGIKLWTHCKKSVHRKKELVKVCLQKHTFLKTN